MRGHAAFVLLLFALATSVASAAPARLVYRIDHATARIEHNRLVIAASGAVSTGGWEKPRLRLHEVPAAQGETLEVEFMATPPRHRAAVVQAVLPVHAKFAARLPRAGVIQVKFVSQTNAVTVPVAQLSSR
jgi:hypothetical protein